MGNTKYMSFRPDVRTIVVALLEDFFTIYQCHQFIPNYMGSGSGGLFSLTIDIAEARIHPSLLHIASITRHYVEGSIEAKLFLESSPSGVGKLTKTGRSAEPLAPIEACNKILHGAYQGYWLNFSPTNDFTYPPTTTRAPYPAPVAKFSDPAWIAEVDVLKFLHAANGMI